MIVCELTNYRLCYSAHTWRFVVPLDRSEFILNPDQLLPPLPHKKKRKIDRLETNTCLKLNCIVFAIKGGTSHMKIKMARLGNTIQAKKTYLDLQALWNNGLKAYDEFAFPYQDRFPKSGRKFTDSLANMVEATFGLPPDSRHTMSNWLRRPLRPEQLKLGETN